MSVSTLAPNGVRGETVVEIDGAPRRLRLTLGALAELETAFDVCGPSAIAARLALGRAADIALALATLLRAGGEGAAADRVLEAEIEPLAAARAVAAAFASAGETPGKP
ncbi:MAG: GTA-gp10 family protein [Pseudomonadota bacterium]